MLEYTPVPRPVSFSVLDTGKQSRSAYVASTALNVLIVLMLVIIGVHQVVVKTRPPQLKSVVYSVSPLAVPPPPPPHMKAVAPPKLPEVKMAMPVPTMARPILTRPAIVPKAPAAPALASVTLNTAPAPAIMPTPTPAPAITVVHPPEPKVGTFGTTTVAQPQPRREVVTKTGGFGSSTAADASSTQRHAVVATAFGSSATAAPSPGSNHAAQTAGFGKTQPAEPQNAGFGSAPPTIKTTVPTVLSVPRPSYTAEARAKHIEGDVIVKVNLHADGRVEVLGVVRSLGSGLDEEALKVARQIQFRPATRGGQPIDFTTTVHINFQIS